MRPSLILIAMLATLTAQAADTPAPANPNDCKACTKDEECGKGLICNEDEHLCTEGGQRHWVCPQECAPGGSMCATTGSCTYNAERRGCVAVSEADCKKAENCKLLGACTLKEGRCIPENDKACEASDGCREHGWCALKGKSCVATTDAHCEQADACRQIGFCQLKNGNCVKGGKQPEKGAAPKR